MFSTYIYREFSRPYIHSLAHQLDNALTFYDIIQKNKYIPVNVIYKYSKSKNEKTLCNEIIVNIVLIDTTGIELQQPYSRNQIKECEESFVRNGIVAETTPVSLREAARKCSNLGGQAYDRYECKQQCKTSKCKCRAAGRSGTLKMSQMRE